MTRHLDLVELPNALTRKLSESPDVIPDNELFGVAGRGQNCTLQKTLSASVNGPNADSCNSNSNTGYLSFRAMPLPTDADAPGPDEFCGPAFNPHIKFLSRWWRWLDGTFFRIRFVQARNNFLNRRGLLMTRRTFSRRFRKLLAGDGKRFVEVIDIDPLLGAHACQCAVFPEPGSLDIEFALLSLIDCLQPVTRDRPLSTHPKDVAMQGHFVGVSEKRLLPKSALSIFLDHLESAHIALQYIGDRDRAVFLLVGFHHRDQRAADRGAGAVQRVHQPRLAVGPPIARIHAPGLEIAAHRAARDFAVGAALALTGHP